MKKKNLFIFIFVSISLLILSTIIFSPGVSSYETIKNSDEEMKIYKSLSCGCCGIYSSYFKSKGNQGIQIINVESNGNVMEENNIPKSLESCHTTIIGNYFIEGHIPLEAIEKLLSEKPDIAGIGMSGMPSGSPGMPGPKSSEFVIYGVNHDRSTFEFMRI